MLVNLVMALAVLAPAAAAPIMKTHHLPPSKRNVLNWKMEKTVHFIVISLGVGSAIVKVLTWEHTEDYIQVKSLFIVHGMVATGGSVALMNLNDIIVDIQERGLTLAHYVVELLVGLITEHHILGSYILTNSRHCEEE